MQLSQKVKELIAKARIVSFAQWQQIYPPEAIAHFQTADDEGRYLSDDDIQQLRSLMPDPAGLAIAQQFRDQAADIVDEARQQVLTTYPDIVNPGGGLYPPVRAEACWRDFWHFLRCMTYGIAGGQESYTSSEGLGYMQQLYQELQVPLDAMVLGLEGIKDASLRRLSDAQQESWAPYFDHLIERLRAFQAAEV